MGPPHPRIVGRTPNLPLRPFPLGLTLPPAAAARMPVCPIELLTELIHVECICGDSITMPAGKIIEIKSQE